MSLPSQKQRFRFDMGALATGFFVLLTAALSLLWSHARLLWQDEFLSFYSDRVASLRQVLAVQLHYPISLDPPTYHLLSHLSMKLVGEDAIALRLPALAGFLLLEIMLFLYVRSIAGSRAGSVAAALPLLTASFRYSVEGRPYGLLLGLYALSLVCWQRAAQRQHERRWRSLLGIAVAIAMAITSHYFGILILIPIGLGELARSLERRSLDPGVLGGMALGMTSIAIIPPFKRGLDPYRTHYYINGVNLHDISQGYRELFVHYNEWPMALQKAMALALVIAVVGLAIVSWRRFRSRPASEPAYLWAGLAATSLLPFFGYLFGKYVTHTMEVRYVIAALIAFAACFAIVLERRLRSDRFYAATLGIILILALLLNIDNIRAEHRTSEKLLAGLAISPACSAAIVAQPDAPIYIQTLGSFYLNTYYQPDSALRKRFSLVYAEAEETRWLGHNTNAITAINMEHFSGLSVTPYSRMLAQPHPLVLLYQSGWEWLDSDLAAKRVAMTTLGTCAGDGQLVRLDTSSTAK